MPIYAYRCEDCGHSKDVLQKLSDPPLVDCPACGKPSFRKQLTAAGFQLKGSGWYVTDFKDKSGGAGKSKASPTSPKSGESPSDATASSDGGTKGTDGSSGGTSAAGGCGTACSCH